MPADIDLMIVATVTPEQPIPHTGAFVGETLGLQCGSFDLNAACAGFVYELVVGASMVQMGYDHVLVVGAETLSRIIDPDDRTTTVLFGDGAGAAVLAPTARDAGHARLGPRLRRLGRRRCSRSPPAAAGCPTSAATVADARALPEDGGPRGVPARGARRRRVGDGHARARRRRRVDDVAWFVPHQANGRIIDAAANRLGIEPERTLVNIDRYGNTSSASIPLALFEAVDDGRVRDGDLVLCSGFGAGMTWASALLRWGAR